MSDRRSPVRFNVNPAETEERNGFEVALRYEGDEEGPILVDLSHCRKFDIQDNNVVGLTPWGRSIPEEYNTSSFQDGVLINRMNRTQAALWQLTGDDLGDLPYGCVTETTDGLCLLAVGGDQALAIMEKATPLDLAAPSRQTPYLIQGPVMHIPCQIVVFRKEEGPLVMMTFSRGYGEGMAEALLDAGREVGLKPGGVKAFEARL